MELHLVHYKSTYGKDFNSAMMNSGNAWDTVAVIGIMFILQPFDNPKLNDVVQGIM